MDMGARMTLMHTLKCIFPTRFRKDISIGIMMDETERFAGWPFVC